MDWQTRSGHAVPRNIENILLQRDYAVIDLNTLDQIKIARTNKISCYTWITLKFEER